MTKAFTMGYQDGINRGPKTQSGIQAVRSLSADDLVDYGRGVKAGMAEIHRPKLTASDIQAEYPVHTEFIGEDNA
jgi:hypothetical protein